MMQIHILGSPFYVTLFLKINFTDSFPLKHIELYSENKHLIATIGQSAVIRRKKKCKKTPSENTDKSRYLTNNNNYSATAKNNIKNRINLQIVVATKAI